MKRSFALAITVIAPLCLFGARNSGCATTSDLPTARQVDANVPSSIRRCPAWPRSPGARASRRQTAEYLVRAQAAYQACGGNMQAVDRILRQREAAVNRVSRRRR